MWSSLNTFDWLVGFPVVGSDSDSNSDSFHSYLAVAHLSGCRVVGLGVTVCVDYWNGIVLDCCSCGSCGIMVALVRY